MPAISVVIICKNEEHSIEKVLQSLEGLTDDIVVYDNDSTDSTKEKIKASGIYPHEGIWEGFGKTKRKATSLAKYDWILSLDADESLDSQLKESLASLSLEGENVVYDISFKNFLGDRYLKYGEWGGDHHIRLYNRKKVNWDDAPVHEKLILPAGAIIKKLKGYVLHQTMRDMKDYADKMAGYAMLNAEKYFRQGKKSNWFKLRMSPGFTFLNYYVLRLGFLDGYAGYICAKMTAYYTFLKYAKLRELWNGRTDEQMNR
jgi:glycosyltransferase involved in cell wall biosynthesis